VADEGLALRGRPAEDGSELPTAALAEDRRVSDVGEGARDGSDEEH